MSQLHCFCACHKLMMQRLITNLHLVRNRIHRPGITFYRTEGKNCTHRHRAGVDFVEGQPVLDFILVTLENHFTVAHKAVNDFPRIPAIVFFHKPVRNLIMGNSNKRLNPMPV